MDPERERRLEPSPPYSSSANPLAAERGGQLAPSVFFPLIANAEKQAPNHPAPVARTYDFLVVIRWEKQPSASVIDVRTRGPQLQTTSTTLPLELPSHPSTAHTH
ncbi:unnamed protein product [Ectocarpus fasciculatus]